MIGVISAGSSCTANGYDWTGGVNTCYENSVTNPNTGINAYSKVIWNFVDDKNTLLGWYGNAMGNLYINVGEQATKFYIYKNIASWDNIVCDDYGCNGEEISSGRKLVATKGETYKTCIVVVAWSRGGSNQVGWEHAWAGYGWFGSNNCFNIKVVECNSNADCSSGYGCDSTETCQIIKTVYRYDENKCVEIKKMGWVAANEYSTLAECQSKITYNYYRLENNQCTAITLTSAQKTANDYATLVECQTAQTGLLTTYYRFDNNICEKIAILPSQKTVNDYTTLSECQNKVPILVQNLTYYRFENNKCSAITILSSQKTVNDYITLSECQSNIISKPIYNYAPFIFAGVIILIIVIGGLITLIILKKVKKKRKR